MPDFYEEVNMLVNDITKQRITREEVAKRISLLKAKYGNDIFPDIFFEKETKPWNKAYLRKLKEKNITGACSEEFILHMAEVSDDIALRKKKMIIGAALTVIALVIIIILLLVFNQLSKVNVYSSSLASAYCEDVIDSKSDLAIVGTDRSGSIMIVTNSDRG